MITVTDNAVKHLQSMIADDPEKSGKALRIYVENGGCAGMQYGMKFDEVGDNDLVAGVDEAKVAIDPESLRYIDGSQIDYKEDLASSGFKIVNPKAVRSCGCGTSFETEKEASAN